MTDIYGSFKETFAVPLGSIPGSTNFVRARSGESILATADHSLPPATLSIDPQEGVPGSIAKITGRNFNPFSRVSVLSIGEVSMLSEKLSPATDREGLFRAWILIPAGFSGVQQVVVEVGGISAVTNYTVVNP